MPRPSVCLNMIVRNEAHVVTDALLSAVSHVDTWVIVDTGSDDGTPEVVEAFFAERQLPGVLHHRPWRDFGTNRTEALDLCDGVADYAWVLDADDLLVGEVDFSALEADAYDLRFGEGGSVYWRTQVFRTDLPWRFVGAVHEYAACDAPHRRVRLDGDYHVESRRLGDRSRAGDKYERDARLLEAAVDEDPDDERSVFYLAQSWMDAGEPERAVEWYERRAAMAGWDEERFVARWRRAQCLERLDRPAEQVLDAYLDAWADRPHRAEPLHDLARFERLADRFERALFFAEGASRIPYPEDDLLFVAEDVYRWRIDDERAISAYYTGRTRESFALCEDLLRNPHLPDAERPRIEANRDYSVPVVASDALTHPADAVARLVDRVPRRDSHVVTLTITTCRRPDLFEATVDSFLNCCTDHERIDRWVCIDDGSSPDDRRRMAERYPFFEFVWKDAADKGHARSMEMLRDLVDTPYWVHLEDDWHFFAPGPYVGDAMAVLVDDPELGQVVLNRNYAETLEDRRVLGGELARTEGGVRYRRHVYLEPGTEAYADLFRYQPPDAASNAWWPHFSLRPSMIRTEALREVGPFDPTAEHFELDYAQRFTGAGWRTAFLDTICSLHLGPLTSERENRRPNAYDLNTEPQFTRPITHRVRLVGNWASPSDLAGAWTRQSEGANRWRTVEIGAVPLEDADRVVVVNHPPPDEDPLPEDRTIVLHMEPRAGVARWGPWAEPNPRRFVQVRSHARFPNPAEWHLDRTWAELHREPIAKTSDVSAVISGKVADPGQRLRVDFVRHLEGHGVPIDVFGFDNSHGFGGYRGALPPRDKRAGLFPFRYTLAAENHAEPNYVTEKLFDALLAECLPFYWGCPNLEEIVDPDAFIRLPLEDPDRARAVMEKAVANDEWARRLPAIRSAKQRILDEQQLFPVIARVVEGDVHASALDIRVVNLDRRPDRWEAFRAATADAASAGFADRCRRFAAVDGRALQPDPGVKAMFAGNDFGSRRSFIGCALSHLAIWRETAAAGGPGALVFEDDARVGPGFRGDLAELCGWLVERHPSYDVALLGWSPRSGSPPERGHRPPRPVAGPWSDYLGGCFAYVVSGSGAARLVDLVERHGIRHGIDRQMQLFAEDGELEVLVADPVLARAPVVTAATPDVDSDVQLDHSTLD